MANKITAVVEIEEFQKQDFIQGTFKLPEKYTLPQRVQMLQTLLHSAYVVAGDIVENHLPDAYETLFHDYNYTRDLLQTMNGNLRDAIEAKGLVLRCSCDSETSEPTESYVQIGSK